MTFGMNSSKTRAATCAIVFGLASGILYGSPAEHPKEPAKKSAAQEAAPAKKGWNKKLPVPLTRHAITFRKGAKGEKDQADEEDQFVISDLRDDPTDVAEPYNIVVNVAQTSGARYTALRVWMISDADDFLEKLNANRQRLIDITCGVLRDKTLEQIESQTIKAVLRIELQSAFNRAFRANLVKEVIIDGPAVQ